MKERLQKILSRAGIASRRAAERMIVEGRVEVDGEVVSELGSLADPETQEIRVDGSRVRPGRQRRYLVLHKPRGFVTTRSDPSRRPTVMELVPEAYRTLYPVGRLDMASTGLIVLTDDGQLAQKLSHPRYRVPKTYLVTVKGSPEPRELERAERGITVEGERLRVDEVVRLGGGRRDKLPTVASPKLRTRLRVTLRQGKNREIRRLFGALGYPVIELHRERIGTLSIRGIPPGGYRRLSRAEVERLKGRERKRPGGRPRLAKKR